MKPKLLLFFIMVFSGCGLEFFQEASVDSSNEGTQSGATFKIEIPIQMGYGGYQVFTSDTTFANSRTLIDTSSYDGSSVTYEFEVICSNIEVTDYSIRLIDGIGGIVKTLACPASTTDLTRIRESFTPNKGADTYSVQIEGGGGMKNTYFVNPRIIITQTNPTKTELYFPLLYSDLTFFTAPGMTAGSTGATVFGTANTTGWPVFKLDLSRYATIPSNAWTYEAVISSDGASVSSTALRNVTDATNVTGTVLSTSSDGSVSYLRASFDSSATNFVDGSEFSVDLIKTTFLARIYKGALRVKLVNLDQSGAKGESYYAGTGNNFTPNQPFEGMRNLINISNFSNPLAAFLEISAHVSAGSTDFDLLDHGANTSGTAGTSEISGATLTFTNTSRTVVRSGDILDQLTDGNNYMIESDHSGGGSQTVGGGATVIQWSKP